MSYTKTAWVDGTTPAISAANLLKLENVAYSVYGNVYNPRDTAYGAVGDGVTDDTTAFQNCVNAACASNGLVIVPPGPYLVTSISVPTSGDFKMVGIGPRQDVILQQKSTGTGSDLPIIYANDGSGHKFSLWVEGIYFKGAGQGLASSGSNERMAVWALAAQDVMIRNCIITDFRDGGINLFPSGNGRIRIEGNRLENCCVANGVNYINAQNTTIFDSFAGDCWITDNYVGSGPTGGIDIGAVSHDATTEQRTIVRGNIVKGQTWAGIAVETDAARYVQIDGNQVYSCTYGIVLQTGGNTFAKIPMIEYVTIRGNIVDSKLIDDANCMGIEVIGSRIICEGNIVRAGGTGIGVFNPQTGVYAEENVIRGNVVEVRNPSTSRHPYAIELASTKRTLVQGNQVRRLSAIVVGAQTVGAGGTLQVNTVAGWPTSGNIRCKGSTYAYTAIAQAASTPTNATITLTAGGTFADGDIVMLGGAGDAIAVLTGQDDQIVDNIITNAGYNGVSVNSSSSRTVVRGNRIISPYSEGTLAPATGIYLDGSDTDAHVLDNIIVDTTGSAQATSGIKLNTGSARAVVRGNLCAGFSTPIVGTAAPMMDRNNVTTSGTAPNGGTSTQTPGAVTTVTIAHGLSATPKLVSVQAANANARGASAFHITVDATNITLNFASALTAATSYSWMWTAEV